MGMRFKPAGVLIFICLLSSSCYVFSQAGSFKPGAYLSACLDTGINLSFLPDTVQPHQVFKGKRIWRIIGLEQEENRQIFATHRPCKELCLFELIKLGVLEKGLPAFDSDNFSDAGQTVLKPAKLETLLNYADTSEVTVFDANGNSSQQINYISRIRQCGDISAYLLKEDWVMNSYTGRMEKYIVALAPVVTDRRTGKSRPLFWLYYPQWAPLFYRVHARNIFSHDELTYYTVFEKHLFFSRITAESNVFSRGINDYSRGYENELESERIKENLRNSESDLFEH